MSDLWLGALLSIPLSLAVNLISTPIGNRLAQRNQAASARRAQQNRAFEAQAQAYSRDRSDLYTNLLSVLIRIAWVGALFGVVSGMLFALASGLAAVSAPIFKFVGVQGYLLSAVASAAGQLIALIGTIIVLNLARGALTTINRVNAIRTERANQQSPG